MFERIKDGFECRAAGEVLRVRAWGPHAVRVQAAAGAIDDELHGALDLIPRSARAQVTLGEDGGARLVNGRMTAAADACGRLSFLRTTSHFPPAGADDKARREVLAEKRPYPWHPGSGDSGPRVQVRTNDGAYHLEQMFEAYEGERIYGQGQHLHGRLDQKGCVIDLVPGSTGAAIPFLYSSRGYGLLWNNPATGRVELGADTTRWVADSAGQIDYWITVGDKPAQIMAAYADATGRPPMLPDWATGFWQSKLHYRTQEELLEVAREYKRRGLPLSAIACDFFHWTRMGDWDFDPGEWPDPAAMIKELDSLGVHLMVSVWPTAERGSRSHDALAEAGGLVLDTLGNYLRRGSERPLSLARSAWAGSQRHGIALWPGDTASTFDSLAVQMRAGLNAAMSGIPWWHTDIGGFQGGDPDDPAYRELLIRWFQYGTFSPIMRLHGSREPRRPFTASMTGGPNQVWSFGEQAYPILRAHLLLRERLRPYLLRLARSAHDHGAPPMRPLFFDFPGDESAWRVEDQFMLGPDLLVAPVTTAAARSRPVYLPQDVVWTEAATGSIYRGGLTLHVAAPLERIPVFIRAGAEVTEAFVS